MSTIIDYKKLKFTLMGFLEGIELILKLASRVGIRNIPLFDLEMKSFSKYAAQVVDLSLYLEIVIYPAKQEHVNTGARPCCPRK